MNLAAAGAGQLEECLAGDGVAVIPTDTVYGLACNPESESALRRVYELKRRPAVKPAAVMFFALEPALDALPELRARTRAAMRALLPGPVTLLLANPERRFPLACLPACLCPEKGYAPWGAPSGVCPLGCDPNGGGSALLGLRVPILDGTLATLTRVGVPAAQSSANISGGPDPRRLQDVPVELREGVDLVLDGGELPGAASTVVDLSAYEQSGVWRIVREGPLGSAELERLLS